MFLSLLRCAMVVSKCQAMNKQKVENHACLVGHYRHYRLYRCISRTTTWRGINKIPKCFSCPGDCKELSKKTKRSTYDSRTKPWPTRPPTSDNNSPITKRIRTNETQNVSLTLATVEDCRRKKGDGTVGTRAVDRMAVAYTRA